MTKCGKILIIAGIILIFNSLKGQTQSLSDRATISILTIGSGSDELYSAFGHSAIRISDPEYQYDAAFNYGTFDFNRPNFYLNFAKGYLVYKLAVQDARALISYYKRSNRSVLEQELNLTQDQKQKVFDFLVENAKPENADYFYDYFYDNCATKIGDVFVEALGNEFRFDENYVDEPGLTIRTLTDRYSADLYPWGKLGIDICLGLPMDKELSNLEYMYLPDYVYDAFEKAQVKNNDGWQPIVTNMNEIFVADESNWERPFITPNKTFWGLFVLVVLLSVFAHRKEISLNWFDFLLFLLFGLLGLFLFLLWTITDHAAAAGNLNLLWAWPTHLIVAFFLLKKKRKLWVNWYLLFTFSLGLILVVFWWAIPQAINLALIPIVLTITVRSGMELMN